VKASGKAFLCLVVVMLVVMTLFFMMSTFKLQTTLTHLVQSQLTVLAESVADPLEGAIDLGLSLSELRNTESLITRAKDHDVQIEAVDIFDLAGQILFSTVPDRVGELVEPEVLEVQIQTDARDWSLDGDVIILSGITLTDNIGQTIGGVLFTYSKAGVFLKVAKLSESLLTNIIVIVVIFSGITFFVVRRSFRDLDRYVGRIDEAMKTFPESADNEPKTAIASSGKAHADPDDLESKLRAVAIQLSRATDEINSFDNALIEQGREGR